MLAGVLMTVACASGPVNPVFTQSRMVEEGGSGP